jgi:hypothetical protein
MHEFVDCAETEKLMIERIVKVALKMLNNVQQHVEIEK